MPNYKLYYFDFGFGAGGRAEYIRVMFHYMGVPFEDVRFDKAEFQQKYKSRNFLGYLIQAIFMQKCHSEQYPFSKSMA